MRLIISHKRKNLIISLTEKITDLKRAVNLLGEVSYTTQEYKQLQVLLQSFLEDRSNLEKDLAVATAEGIDMEGKK